MTNTTTRRHETRAVRRYCRAKRASAEAPLEFGRIIVGDALKELRRLPAHSVDCVITSPPFFLLRNYGVAGQLGQEDTVKRWVDNLAAVARELARVLTPRGTFWLNLGDSYSRHERYGAPPKSLLLGPERLLLRGRRRLDRAQQARLAQARPDAGQRARPLHL
jgi:hypothetical protein